MLAKILNIPYLIILSLQGSVGTFQLQGQQNAIYLTDRTEEIRYETAESETASDA